MRIAFLVGKFPCLSQPFIINQIIGLLDQGHEVDIYALEGPSHEDQSHPQVRDYRLLERTRYGVFPSESLPLRLLQGLGLILRYGWRYPRSLLAVLNLFKYGKRAASLRPLFAVIPFLPRQQYDIIHAQFGVYALLGADLRAMGRLQGKLIATFRGFDISEYVRRCGAEVYTDLFAVSDGILTNCEFFRQRLIALGCPAEQVQVHYSSIDCQRFTFQPRSLPPGAPIRIVTVGRLVEKKGIEYALRAIAQLRPLGIDLEYTLVGDGPL
ncbi:MAG: glycosyltransferase, partial [Leptolyngbya sp.]|nr:glycosyltransferase [Leptolyngbya sp.]